MKTLIALAVAAAFAAPLAASAQSDTDKSARQPGANPPGAVSPGTPREATTGIDRETGADRRTNPSPGMGSTGGMRARSFDNLDKNGDGFISRDEADGAAELNTRFSELDTNNDGKISREEYRGLETGTGARGATGMGSPSGMGGAAK